MIKYYCDHCGKIMRHNNVVILQIEELPGHFSFEYDICDECVDKLKNEMNKDEKTHSS